ncbi:type IV conjugative transfer system lipoprotein TraV [Vibrio cincinnatiensis]|uniref:type IV conjugative transfer system lipoprotein TraV n=1 Tax=Vibrio cincinnatiensis TaxID=675 RepID=UPI001EDEC863|nr:type IV conjugative transfer system lipoprotein TraV [Vibrio cincinnatiensis]MCG3741162.1 type IV conjugative transfer system protein TraV [Vibrio cincinnatiensis]
MKKSLFVGVLFSLLLGGCAAGLGEDYSCKKVGGVPGCTSMDQVRDNIHLYTQGDTTTKNITAVSPSVPSSFIDLPRRDRHGMPSRTNDVVKKVTIFPFVDTQGNYVDTTDIYIILDDSRWTGRPAPAIWRD